MSTTLRTIAGASTATTDPLPVALTIDGASDYLPIYTASATATQAINRQTLLGVTGQPADISSTQTLSNKTLDNSTALTIKDGSLTLQNSSSSTKQATFSLASITAGQTRVITVPDSNLTLVGTSLTQTLTNKTLTSPTINGGTIDNATVTVDSIAGHTSSTLGTVYGLSISNGVLNTNNSVKTSNIQAAAVTAATMQYGMVRRRQGGVSGDGDWMNAGTTNTDTSAKAVFWQAGSIVPAGQTTTVTFPVPFTYTPIMMVTPSGSGGTFSAGWYTVNESATSFQFVAQDYTHVSAFHWIAVGQ